jgi:hypothetical protein
LRGEFLNFFNLAQFSAPVSNIANSDFGRITGTRDPRIAQISLRLAF